MLLQRLFGAVALVVLVTLSCAVASAQHQRDHIYLDNGLMLDFTGPAPHLDTVPSGKYLDSLDGGGIALWYWRATSDPQDGKLLFLTDGVTLFNRDFHRMKNGGLLCGERYENEGGYTQHVWSCPVPGDDSSWFLFMNFLQHPLDALYEARIDMRGDNGRGKVVLKNSLLSDRAFSSMTIIRHSDGYHYWLILGKLYSDSCFSYLVGPSGVEGAPVISIVPIPSGRFGTGIEQLDASNDGQEIGDFNNIYHFDAGTGHLVLWRTFQGLVYRSSAALSPNGRYQYISHAGKITQYDLFSSTEQAIYDSAIVVGSSSWGPLWGTDDEIHAILLAPDNKIYGAHNLEAVNPALCSIDSPDVRGLGCSYRDTAFHWDETWGWPYGGRVASMQQSVVGSINRASRPPIDVSSLSGCESCYSFGVTDSSHGSITWSFEGGTPATASGMFVPNVCFDTIGPRLVRAFTSTGDTLSTLAFCYAQTGIATPLTSSSVKTSVDTTVDVPVSTVLHYSEPTRLGAFTTEVEIRFDSTILTFDPADVSSIQLPAEHELVGVVSRPGYLQIMEEDTTYSFLQIDGSRYSDIDTLDFGSVRFHVKDNPKWDQTVVELARVQAQTDDVQLRFCASEMSPLARITRSTESVHDAVASSKASVSPNPVSAVHGSIDLSLAAQKGESIDLRIFDIQGQQISDAQITGTGAEHTYLLAAPNLPGSYFIRIARRSGTEETLPFVVVR